MGCFEDPIEIRMTSGLQRDPSAQLHRAAGLRGGIQVDGHGPACDRRAGRGIESCLRGGYSRPIWGKIGEVENLSHQADAIRLGADFRGAVGIFGLARPAQDGVV